MKALDAVVWSAGLFVLASGAFIGYQESKSRFFCAESPDTEVSEEASEDPSGVAMGWDRTARPKSQPKRARKNDRQPLSATEQWELEQRRAEWAETRNREALERGNKVREDWDEEQRRAADDRAIEAMREKERQRRAVNRSPSAAEPSERPEGIPLEMTRRKDPNNPFNLGDPPRESAPRNRAEKVARAEQQLEQLEQSARDCKIAKRYKNSYTTSGCEGIEKRVQRATERLTQIRNSRN